MVLHGCEVCWILAKWLPENIDFDNVVIDKLENGNANGCVVPWKNG